VHFCVPGVSAMSIYMQAVNAPPETNRKALLNDAPSANVYSQLQKLTQQNPSCESHLVTTGHNWSQFPVLFAVAQNLQSIIQDQIQSLSGGAQQQQQQQQQQQVEKSSSAQAALMILLTAQQGREQQLQDPRVVNLLQSYVDAAANPTVAASAPPLAELLSDPALTPLFGQQGQQPAGPATAPSWPGADKENDQGAKTRTPPIVSNNLNNLMNAQNLNELLGVISSPGETVPAATAVNGAETPRRPVLAATRRAVQRPVLLADQPSQPAPASALLGQFPGYPPPPAPASPYTPYPVYYPYLAQQQQELHQQQQLMLAQHQQQMALYAQQQQQQQLVYMSQPQVDAYVLHQQQMAAATLAAQAASGTPPGSHPGQKRKLPIPPSPEDSPQGL